MTQGNAAYVHVPLPSPLQFFPRCCHLNDDKYIIALQCCRDSSHCESSLRKTNRSIHLHFYRCRVGVNPSLTSTLMATCMYMYMCPLKASAQTGYKQLEASHSDDIIPLRGMKERGKCAQYSHSTGIVSPLNCSTAVLTAPLPSSCSPAAGDWWG